MRLPSAQVSDSGSRLRDAPVCHESVTERDSDQTAVVRGPKRIVFTNFLTFRAETWQALFFISQRVAGRPIQRTFEASAAGVDSADSGLRLTGGPQHA